MIRILIVDDHAVVRDGIKRMSDAEQGTVVFGEASTPDDAITQVREEDWDAMILDLTLGDRSGLEVLKEVHKIRPKLRVLILSMHSEEQYARRAFKAGASGYITKDSTGTELVGAIRKILLGGISPVSTFRQGRGRFFITFYARANVIDSAADLFHRRRNNAGVESIPLDRWPEGKKKSALLKGDCR